MNNRTDGLEPTEFSAACHDAGLSFVTGVPDSTLGPWLETLDDPGSPFEHQVAVNECEAAALAAGYHLATDEVGLVYTQNDGLGKIVNPLTSLLDPIVFGIPLVLVIGWRGEPGREDAPQHDRMGEILWPLLDLLAVPAALLPSDPAATVETVHDVVDTARERSGPAAIVVSRGTFATPDVPDQATKTTEFSREDAVISAADAVDSTTAIVATTGKIARELYEYRDRTNTRFERDVYCVGAMGCAQSIALGITVGDPDRSVLVLDGDGSVLMQLGAMATTGARGPGGLHHVILDNGAHDSTGGQPTVAPHIDFESIARGCGYSETTRVDTKADLASAIEHAADGPTLTVAQVDRGARSNLGRPPPDLRPLVRKFVEFSTAVE